MADAHSSPEETTDRALEEVGRRIAELRVEARLTQADVAERLGTGVPNYVRIERGLNVTVRTLVRLAAIFGVERHELLRPPVGPAMPRKVGRPRKRVAE